MTLALPPRQRIRVVCHEPITLRPDVSSDDTNIHVFMYYYPISFVSIYDYHLTRDGEEAE